jgi:Family of unknown function (DUF6611)
MTQVGARVASPRFRTWWLNLLDGGHLWGSFDAMIGRYGLRRYRLTVFPPGITAADRRLLRAWRGWPVGGAAVALLATMCLSEVILTPMTTLVVCAGVYVVVGAALFVMSAAPRTQVRPLSVILIDGYSDPRSEAMYAEWEAVIEMLATADEMRERGELSSVEYEAMWWHAYNRVGVALGV